MELELPKIYLLSTHLQPTEQHDLEEKIPTLTYDVNEAEVVVGKISRQERALFELRRLQLDTVPIPAQSPGSSDEYADIIGPANTRTKRRKISASEARNGRDKNRMHYGAGVTIKVLKLSWLTESIEQGNLMPMEGYLVYEGFKKAALVTTGETGPERSKHGEDESGKDILNRAAEDFAASTPLQATSYKYTTKTSSVRGRVDPVMLARESASDHDTRLPMIPDYLHTTYSCQRPSPIDPPNSEFIEELKSIRLLRLLKGDPIGVRAYSTSISALTAYPNKVETAEEIAALPGCGTKIAELYDEWRTAGKTPEVRASESDSKVAVIRRFHNIWGVGDKTAREFYQKGWRDLDDVVESGWNSLSRVQQIGVKYYDEFLLMIPRVEVENIGHIIFQHVRRFDENYEMKIVGGYRRGKGESGDVDVIISHRKETLTLNFVEKLILSLERANFVTHTLSLWTRNSERNQVPLPWKGESRGWGNGFDTLDKALVVWQDPRQENSPHRRVDIIVSPWKTVGCALLGWSGDTTFQRDLRRYCKKEKNLKFDSSGIRSRTDGSWVDLEGIDGEAPSMEEAEKTVFAGLGLTWRAPHERCTG